MNEETLKTQAMKLRLAKLSPLFNFGWMITLKLRSDIRGSKDYIWGSLLDIGCGGKVYENIIGAWVDHYWGVELPGTLSSGMKVDVWADGMRLPFAAGSFDTVLCTQVIEHVADPQMLLSEITRVLREGEHLVLTAPFTGALHEEPHDYCRFSKYGLQVLLQRAGLEVVEILAQGGFWLNFGQNFGFYLMDHSNRNRVLRAMIRLAWGIISPFFFLMDRFFTDERYTMNYFVVAAKL